jgi:hypothetical protein
MSMTILSWLALLTWVVGCFMSISHVMSMSMFMPILLVLQKHKENLTNKLQTTPQSCNYLGPFDYF